MAACLLFACKPAPSAESLLGAAPLPSYGLADFAVHPGLGVPVGKRHLIAMFTDTADGPAIADALAQAGVTIAGGQSEPPIAFVTVPDDRGWDGLDAAHAALAAHPAVAAVAHDLVLASTHERTLDVVPLGLLRRYAVDVPDDPGELVGVARERGKLKI